MSFAKTNRFRMCSFICKFVHSLIDKNIHIVECSRAFQLACCNYLSSIYVSYKKKKKTSESVFWPTLIDRIEQKELWQIACFHCQDYYTHFKTINQSIFVYEFTIIAKLDILMIFFVYEKNEIPFK